MSTRPNLFCFGLGYSAEHHIREWGARFDRIAGTVREADKAAQMARDGIVGNDVETFVFDGASASGELASVLCEADCVLVSVPPDHDGDPVLRSFGEALAGADRVQSIVYLSTVGVYGDNAGAWVDEETPARPTTDRSRALCAYRQERAACSEHCHLTTFEPDAIMARHRLAACRRPMGQDSRTLRPALAGRLSYEQRRRRPTQFLGAPYSRLRAVETLCQPPALRQQRVVRP